MEALLMFILKVYVATVGISALVKICKEVKANKIIEENGYEVIMGDKEIQEEIADFFKENFYILKPIKNIKKSWELIWGNNKKYASKKIEKLQSDNKLKLVEKPKMVQKDEQEQIKQKVKKDEIKITEKEVTPSREKNNELIIDEFKEEIESSNDIAFILEIKNTYRLKSKEERKKYNDLAQEFKITTNKDKKATIKEEVTKICRRVKAYDELYLTAKTRLIELQNTMNITRK